VLKVLKEYKVFVVIIGHLVPVIRSQELAYKKEINI